MRHIETYDLHEHIERDLGYLDPEGTIGALYDPVERVLYVGSGRDAELNYTIAGVETAGQADEVVGILKGVQDHGRWEELLKDAGFEIFDGGRYMELSSKNKNRT